MNATREDTELATTTITIGGKRFSLDVKENKIGRFIKIRESDGSGSANKVLLPSGGSPRVPRGAAENNGIKVLCDAFEAVMKEAGDGMSIAPLTALGVSGNADVGKPGEGDLTLGSKAIQIDSKRFFFDLKQNRIGRFLKITESLENGTKQKIAIPAANVGQFRDLVLKFVEMDIKDRVLPPGSDGAPPPLHSESMKIDMKVLFMDLKSNVRGRLLKISSVGNDNRTFIALPGRSAQLDVFAKALTDMLALDDSSAGSLAPSEETLAESIVQVQSKRFFIDLKSNLRGKFLKVTEVGDGNRNKIIIPGDGIVRFYEAMHSFAGKNARGSAPKKPAADVKSTTVHSDMMVIDGKTFYLDLLDNSRGRVMKVSQIASDQRVSIMLPAIGLEGFTGALASVLREGGELVVEGTNSTGEAPGKPGEGNIELASKLVPIEGKRFFLDLKENEIGRFLQMAEVDQGGRRTKMILPLSAVGQFRDTIGVFADLDMSALGRQAYTDTEGRPAALRSELLKFDRKQIHFDLTANAKGCVLKVSMRDDQRGRTTLMIPSTGLSKLRDAFTSLCG